MTSFQRTIADRILTSYQEQLGCALVPTNLANVSDHHWLDQIAPFGVLAQSAGALPRFIYANRFALLMFGYSLDELMNLDPQHTALEEDRDERRRLLEVVRREGAWSGTMVRRVSKTGQILWLECCWVWNMGDLDGEPLGLAAVYRRKSLWQSGDGVEWRNSGRGSGGSGRG